MSASIDHCPELALVSLPADTVKTYDGSTPSCGTVLYFRFAPGPHASEYIVVSDRAVVYDKQTKIIVVGSKGIVAGMDPLHFVTEVATWEKLFRKRLR